MRTNFGEITPAQKLMWERAEKRLEEDFGKNSFIGRILKQQKEETMEARQRAEREAIDQFFKDLIKIIEGGVARSKVKEAEAEKEKVEGTRVFVKFSDMIKDTLKVPIPSPKTEAMKLADNRNRLHCMVDAGLLDISIETGPVSECDGSSIGMFQSHSFATPEESGCTWNPVPDPGPELTHTVRCSGLSFGEAIQLLKQGACVAREGWNGKGLWLELQVPDANSKMTLPYIFICYPSNAKNTPGARVPWLASQTDMLADDWMVV